MSEIVKKTSYPRSICLTLAEYQDCRDGKVEKIEVISKWGKPIAVLPKPVIGKLVLKAKLMLVGQERQPLPKGQEYWLMNF